MANIGTPAPLPHPPVRYNFLYGALASRDFPSLAWKRAYQHALQRPPHSLSYARPRASRRCAARCRATCGARAG
nr:hypothetical protein [Bordetella pertussis]